MKKEKNVWAIAFLIAFWLLTPNQTNAQQDSTSVTALAEVVVTATKFAKSQTETGKVLTIIDEGQIKQSSGKDLSQLLSEQAGLFINGANSNPGKDKSVFLRGAKSEYTLVLLDGVPLNDPSSIGGGAYDLRLIPIDQVERIEILKGNQSTLYGSNAIAGVINIFTRKEGVKPVGGSAMLSYGSYNTFRGSANVGGSFSKLSYSVGGSRSTSDGISEAKDSTNNANFDRDEYSQNSINASITYKPLNSIRLQPYVRFSDFDGRYDGGQFVDGNNNYTSDLFNVGISSDYTFDKGALHLFYGYDKSNRAYENKDFGTTYKYKGRFHHGELFLNNDLSKKFQLLSGVGYQSWHMLDETAIRSNPSVTLISPYASLFLRNLGGFSAEVGGRYNAHSEYGNDFTFSLNPSWMIKNLVKVFLNASSGFKAPSLQQLYGQFGANPGLKPERSMSYEGGVQFFVINKVDTRIVAFQRAIDDVIFYGATGYVNLNEQRDKGVDLETSWSFKSNWKAKAFYSYVDGSLVVNGDAGPGNLLRIPRHSFGLNVQGQILQGWRAGVNFRHTGKRNDAFFNLQTFTSMPVSLSAYQLLDFYSEYSLKKFKFFLDAKNLLKQDYFEVYGYSVLRTTIHAGVTVSF